ncbi:PilW family protein [uncultured Thiodictyon sp.]|uniref:PilW family protein n=1 Tax=uncultured Thiodictyon sp. TaxID=1846217 RepID=UPI0025FE868C|nr:PilW family protein [uncultured Thiodictyon sp.]
MNKRPSPLSPRPTLCGWLSGFTLIELMIALTIGLLMLVALVGLFASSSRSNNELAKMNSLIENGRFAMQLLQDDLILAGFWGTFLPDFNDLYLTTPPIDLPLAVPDPCLAYASWDAAYRTNLIGTPVQVYDAIPTSCSSVITNRLANTDILVVRYAESCALLWNTGTSTWSADPTSPNCEANVDGKLYFQSSLQPVPTPTGCTAESRYVLGTTGFTLHKGNCGAYANKRKFNSHVYYIRNYAATSGDGIPTLVRADFDLAGGTLAHQTATALIEGIEGFRVELGFDTLSKTTQQVDYYSVPTQWDSTSANTPKNRGDGIPDGPFARCTNATTGTPCIASCSPSGQPTTCNVATYNCNPTTDTACIAKRQLVNVTAARVYVLVRARERTLGYTDAKTYHLGSGTTTDVCSKLMPISPCTLDSGYKRHTFSTTVRLTNVSARRDMP